MDTVVNVLLFSLTGISFILAVYLVAQETKSSVNKAFAGIILSGGLWAFSIAMFRSSTSTGDLLMWAWVIYAVGSLSAICFLWFASVFPLDKNNVSFTRLLILNFPVYLFPILIYTKTFILSVDLTNHTIQLGPLYPVWATMFGVFALYSFYLLYQQYLVSTGIQKNQLKYILCSFALPGTTAAAFNIVFPFFGNFRYIWIGPIFLTVMIAIIGYSIINHRLMDIKIVSRDFLSRMLIIVILSSISGAAAKFYGVISGYPVHAGVIFPIVGAMTFVVVTFDYFNKIAMYVVQHFLVQGSYIPKELLEKLSAIAATTIDSKTMLHHFARTLYTNLKTSYVLFALIGGTEEKKLVTITKHGLSTLSADECIILIEQPISSAAVKDIRARYNIAFIYQLWITGRAIGILVIGEKKYAEQFSLQDKTVLDTFASQAKFAIENGRLFSETRRFNRTLKTEVTKATDELQENITKLERANRKLLELDKLKDEFVSLTSHELRTPLTTINNYVWMVLEGKAGAVTRKQREYLNKVASSTKRLSQQITDMLTISKIEAGKYVISPKPEDIISLTVKIAKELHRQTRHKHIAVEVLRPAHTIPSVLIDKDKISEVITNLIGNALKFTPPNGTVTISFRKEQQVVVTTISDTGPGIAPEDQKKLFRKFGRLAHSFATIAETTGTGLGLYICKQIVQAHQGTIGVTSTQGKGSSFYFKLPAA